MEKQLSAENIQFIKKSLIVMIGLFLISNIITVIINTLLNQFLISPEFQETVKIVQRDPVIALTSNVLPFPIIILAVFYFTRGIFRQMKLGFLNEKSLVKLVNIPMYFSILASAGWILGTVLFQSQIMIRGFSSNWLLIIESTLLTLSMAVVSFVFCFYLLDFFQRRWLVPKLFQGSEYSEIPNGFRPSLRQRFFIYILTTSALPGFITFRLLQIFNNNGDNIYAKSLTLEIIVLYFMIGIIVVAITLFLTHSIRVPLDKMEYQANLIRQGNYSSIMLVDTRDEIGALSSTMNSMTESLAEKELIKDTFGRMVDPSVRDHLLRGNMNLGGEESEAVVLFSDLAGFTSLSENRSPDDVVALLNRYFGLMADCVRDHGGIVNKFIGDAILAVFGMPVPLESASDSAVLCALAMQKAGKSLNEDLNREGLPPMYTRIGIHRGKVIAGNIGSSSRMEYTVIGDTVNTASRLESACKKLDVSILISDSVINSLRGNFNTKRIGSLRLKGKTSLIESFTIL